MLGDWEAHCKAQNLVHVKSLHIPAVTTKIHFANLSFQCLPEADPGVQKNFWSRTWCLVLCWCNSGAAELWGKVENFSSRATSYPNDSFTIVRFTGVIWALWSSRRFCCWHEREIIFFVNVLWHYCNTEIKLRKPTQNGGLRFKKETRQDQLSFPTWLGCHSNNDAMERGIYNWTISCERQLALR